MTPDQLVRLLADPDRRAVVSALVLGADDLDAVRRMTALDLRRATVAVQRLVDGGLVLDGGDHLVMLGAAFTEAARATAPPPTHGPVDERAKVLKAFVSDGRITAIPTQHAKRMVLLEMLAQDFEVGRRYSEAMVNLILGKWHPDTAAWRRYLVDNEFLAREDRQYWRIGGPVDV